MLACGLVLPLAMWLAWLALTQSHLRHLEQEQASRLQLQAYILLGNLSVNDDALTLTMPLAETRYQYLGSGLYSQVAMLGGQPIWRSPSARLFSLAQKRTLFAQPEPLPDSADLPVEQFDHYESDDVYRYQFVLPWQMGRESYPVVVTVLEVDDWVAQAYSQYKQSLTLWLSIVLVLALIAQVLILRWGLAPLRRMAMDIHSIKKGEQTRLAGSYPKEVKPLVTSLNVLLESEQQQRQRYSHTMGDLAHSLKTPLAVILGADTQLKTFEPYRDLVRTQAQRMDQIVQYQLGRAVKAKPVIQHQGCPVLPLIERICVALEKVYRDEEMTVSWDVSADLACFADERDMMELLGNVLENAFKYGASEVRVSAERQGEQVGIFIEDDGPGISQNRRDQIMQRGQRLDTTRQGQGIGLTVAADIIHSYKGHIEVSQSASLKGACFALWLPAA